VGAAEDQQPVEALGSDGATKRSATAFALDARTACGLPRSFRFGTASKLRLNLLSRSRIFGFQRYFVQGLLAGSIK
jgi:hypothetical protein